MSHVASLVMLAFTLKILAATLAGQVLRPRLGGLLETATAAWLSVQVILIAGLLLLSAFSAVSQPGVWGVLVIVAAAAAWAATSKSPRARAPGLRAAAANPEITIAVVSLLVVFGLLTFRSFLFPDLTWDGVVYELPRIAFWSKHQSLFVSEPTDAINIFTNEWNGELNALFYVVASGSEIAAAFGNVEVWLFTCLSLGWLAQLLGAPARFALLGGLVMATTPCLLGLAMTVKGDLLSVAGMAAAVGFGMRYAESSRAGVRDEWTAVFGLAAVGVAAGAKIVTLPTTAVYCAVFLAWIALTHPTARSVRIVAAGLVALAIGCARYLVNYVQYGDPFTRIESPGAITVQTLAGNLRGLLTSIFEIFVVGANPPYFWVLSSGLGFLSAGLIVWLSIGLGARDARGAEGSAPGRATRIGAGETWAVGVPLAIGLSAALLAIPWQPWSLRYFAPWLMVGVAWLLAVPLRFLSPRIVRLSVIPWVMVIAANLWLAFGRPGEALPIPFSEALARTTQERKYVPFPQFDTALQETVAGSSGALRILLSNRVNSAVYPFFGENYRNDIELVNTANRLVRRVQSAPYDLVVFSGAPLPDEPQLGTFLTRLDYSLTIDNSSWRVYAHKAR